MVSGRRTEFDACGKGQEETVCHREHGPSETKPVHNCLMDVLCRIPMDGTFDQSYLCGLAKVLDFDFEKFCSISLSNLNVYACLVCGKYYQGRGLKSHAYTHCLPDGYEINDPSLDDIRHVLNPRFTREQVLNLDKNKQWSRALDGSNYLPGMFSYLARRWRPQQRQSPPPIV